MNKGCFSIALMMLTAMIVSAACAAKNKAPAPPPRAEKIRAIIFTGGHPFDREGFFDIFNGHPDLTWKEIKEDEAPEVQPWFSPEKSDEYDVMVWYDAFKPISEVDRKNLQALLNKGKPLVALHHSIAKYQEWPEGIKIIGGRWNSKPRDGLPKSIPEFGVDMHVKIADPTHPITRFMKDFDIKEETYNQLQMLPEVKPLLITDNPKSNKLLGWTHTYGKSPVVYLLPGHGPSKDAPDIFKNSDYRRLVIQAIRWAVGKLPDPSDEGFVPLFNGKNLDGWTVMGDPKGFAIKDGVIRSESGKGGEWLRYDKTFSDFILRAEWRICKNGNSGVFVRGVEGSDPWIHGWEVQISNNPRDNMHCTGALYDLVAVDPRPDESADIWHEFEIQCRGPKIKVFADNIPVIDVDGRQVPELKEKSLTGYIGLQDAHEPGWVEYRKILIKELP